MTDCVGLDFFVAEHVIDCATIYTTVAEEKDESEGDRARSTWMRPSYRSSAAVQQRRSLPLQPLLTSLPRPAHPPSSRRHTHCEPCLSATSRHRHITNHLLSTHLHLFRPVHWARAWQDETHKRSRHVSRNSREAKSGVPRRYGVYNSTWFITCTFHPRCYS